MHDLNRQDTGIRTSDRISSGPAARWLLAGLIGITAAVVLKILAACVLPLEFSFRLNRWLFSLDLTSFLDPEPLIRELFGSLEGPGGELLREFLGNVSKTAVFQAVRWIMAKLSGLAGNQVTDVLAWAVPAFGAAALIQEFFRIWALACGWIFWLGLRREKSGFGLRGLRLLSWVCFILHYFRLRDTERFLAAAVLPALAYLPGLAGVIVIWMLARIGFGILILFHAEVIHRTETLQEGREAENGRPLRFIPAMLAIYALFSLAYAVMYSAAGLILFGLSHLALSAGCVCIAVFARWSALREHRNS